jgi:CheY-like chemotaxis protein
MFREGDEINALLGAKLLIAEDNGINQEVIEGLLEPYGLNLHLVGNGRAAVNAVQEEQFDLILMDIQMPDLDGMQATEQIQQMQLTKTPPIIAMTAHAMREDVEHCLSIGMSDHIAKPIDPDRLKEVLLRWIEPRVFSGMALDESTSDHLKMPCILEGINLNMALRSTAGNKKLLKRLMVQFVDDYQEEARPAKEMLSVGDWQALTYWLHTLKGTSATLGMTLVAGEASKIERMLFNNTLPRDADLIPLEQAFTTAVEAIKSCIHDKAVLSGGAEKNEVTREQSFINSISPIKSTSADPEHVMQFVASIRKMLQEGDADVLDKVPELMELVQTDEVLLDKTIKLLELVESYEFDQALEELTDFNF